MMILSIMVLFRPAAGLSPPRLLGRLVAMPHLTWVHDSANVEVRHWRSAWLLCLLTGLVQKPLVRHAWDVQVTVKTMAALRAVCEAPEVLGSTLILLRQVYAQKGQQMVGSMALELKGTWTVGALRTLAGGLENMHRKDNRKDKGRMRMFTGPDWIRLVAGDCSHHRALLAAGRLLGQCMLASAVAEVRPFSFYFDKLTKGAAKLPRVATYGIAGLLRALCAVLADMGRPALSIDEADWIKHIRDMTSDTTAVAFRNVQVLAFADAEVMVAVIKHMCSKFMGFRRASLWRRLDVMDLSCQSCEFVQVLRATQRARPHLSSLEEAAAWLCEHLPRDDEGIRLMSKTLKVQRARVDGKGDGRDLQSGFVVATDWLNSLDSLDSGAAAVGEGEGSASEVLERLLPQSRCDLCGASLSPPFRSCGECRRERKAERKIERRRERAGPGAKRARLA